MKFPLAFFYISLLFSVVHLILNFIFSPVYITFLCLSFFYFSWFPKLFLLSSERRVLEHNQNNIFCTTSSKYVHGFEWDSKLPKWSWHVKWCSTEWITFSSLDKVGDLKCSDLNWNYPPDFSLNYINSFLFSTLNSKSYLSTYIVYLQKPYQKFCFSLCIIGYIFELFF